MFMFSKLCVTNSKEQIPSWQVNRSSSSQEIPHILCKPKGHYRIYKSPQAVSILSHIQSMLSVLLLEDPF